MVTAGYSLYLINGQFIRLKKCDKPDCDRLTSALYCCPSCTYADEKAFELEEGREPPLGHTSSCDDRNKQRQELKPF